MLRFTCLFSNELHKGVFGHFHSHDGQHISRLIVAELDTCTAAQWKQKTEQPYDPLVF